MIKESSLASTQTHTIPYSYMSLHSSINLHTYINSANVAGKDYANSKQLSTLDLVGFALQIADAMKYLTEKNV
jgi:hypothetical protein